MSKSSIPCLRHKLIQISRIGTPWILSRHLGSVSVSGRRRVPWPAASKNAFIFRGATWSEQAVLAFSVGTLERKSSGKRCARRRRGTDRLPAPARRWNRIQRSFPEYPRPPKHLALDPGALVRIPTEENRHH